jgi:hypothetical protein
MESNREHQGNKSGIQCMHVRVCAEGVESFCARSACFMIFFPTTDTDCEGDSDIEWKMAEYK